MLATSANPLAVRKWRGSYLGAVGSCQQVSSSFWSCMSVIHKPLRYPELSSKKNWTITVPHRRRKEGWLLRMWVRNHQGGNDLVGSVLSGPPWSFHKSPLSGALPGCGVMALLFYRFLDMTHSIVYCMSLLYPGIFLTIAVRVLRQSYFSLTVFQYQLVSLP